MRAVRTYQEIFDELRVVCKSPGFLHAISVIVRRDFYMKIDVKGGVKRDANRRPARSVLNNNELMLLVGLLIQSDNADVYQCIGDTESLIARADRLLDEFHEALEQPLRQMFQEKTTPDERQQSYGEFAREGIYYGAESAYCNQYKRFARERYRNDYSWLLANKGISVKPMIQIADYIQKIINAQVTMLMHRFDEEKQLPPASDLSNAFLVSKSTLSEEFGQKAASFLKAFSIRINGQNKSFDNPFAFNEANARPLLDLDKWIYVSNQFKLFESIYESPFYWMLEDEDYKDTASKNRGKFLERSVTKLFEKVFGKKHVHSNVIVRRKKSDVAAEADVLVIYGEFLFAVQAKSKRLTLKARSGDTEKIKDDFRSSVQYAYDQSLMFIDVFMSGVEAESNYKKINTPRFLMRGFPIVVLSDHFPSLEIMSKQLLSSDKDRFPAIFNIFFLDAMIELLSDPVEVIYYLQQRSRFFDKISSDSEYNLLGFHMKHKLFFGSDVDFAMIDRDFASDIDDYYAAKNSGLKPKITSFALEARIGVPRIGDVIAELKAGPPEVAGLAIELLDLSGQSAQSIADLIEVVREEVNAGKPFKAFSFDTQYGGITYAAAKRLDHRTYDMAEAVAHKYKYKMKKDRWYVLLDCVTSPRLIDNVLPICRQWEDSKEMRDYVGQTDTFLKSTFAPLDSATHGKTEENTS